MPDDPLDLVLGAVEALKNRGSHVLASADALARLAGTCATTKISKPASLNAGQPAVPPDSAQRPGQRLTEMFAAATSQPATPVSAPPPLEPRRAASDFSPAPGATEIAPKVGTKTERLAAMRGPVLACAKCPKLVASRTQVVFGVGNPEAELMFVGEAPGAEEDLAGEPFVGKAGQLLTKIIETMGFQRRDVYIANVLKCRPDMPPGSSGNRKPTGDEMATCKPYLLEQIGIIRPRVLVALGATAMEGLLGEQKIGITRARGNWRDFHGTPLMPTFHPAYLLRNQSLAEKRKVWEDMLAVLELLGRPISDRQRGFFLSK